MSKPVLTIIAGCNGSGKSTFSRNLVNDTIVPFDFDMKFKGHYDSLHDSDFREIMAQNITAQEFETFIHDAFAKRENCCYETNFDAHPLHWADIAKSHGYLTQLLFICLDTIELARERIQRRYLNNGHFVPDNIVYYKWKMGYKNLNQHYSKFDHVVLFDNSSSEQPLQALFSIKQTDAGMDICKYQEKLPRYSRRRFPNMFSLVADIV